jgi:hypothetical protein
MADPDESKMAGGNIATAGEGAQQRSCRLCHLAAQSASDQGS